MFLRVSSKDDVPASLSILVTIMAVVLKRVQVGVMMVLVKVMEQGNETEVRE